MRSYTYIGESKRSFKERSSERAYKSGKEQDTDKNEIKDHWWKKSHRMNWRNWVKMKQTLIHFFNFKYMRFVEFRPESQYLLKNKDFTNLVGKIICFLMNFCLKREYLLKIKLFIRFGSITRFFTKICEFGEFQLKKSVLFTLSSCSRCSRLDLFSKWQNEGEWKNIFSKLYADFLWFLIFYFFQSWGRIWSF